MQNNFTDIDSYINQFPKEISDKLNKIRAVISKAAPKAEEKISYAMPTFYLEGNLVHFAMCKTHIGFYPAPSAINFFKKELANYKTSKGAIQFPFDEKLPVELISKIVKYRLAENLEKALKKKSLKKCKNGHQFYKTSDCPTCPICEKENKPDVGFLSLLAAPARRALENAGIKTLKQLSKHTEKEILDLHGMGKASLPTLNKALKDAGLKFK